jgi:hypothetical protein
MGKKSIAKMKDVVYHTFRKEYPEKVGTSLTLKEALKVNQMKIIEKI